MRRFMTVSNYCFGYSDSDVEGTYDPARECFVVELRMPRASDEDEGVGNRSPYREGQATPHLHALSSRWCGTRTPPARNFDALTWSSSVSFRPRSNKTDSFCNSSKTLSSESSGVVVMAEQPDGGLVTSTTASTTTKGESTPQSSIVLARTSRQQ